MYFILKICLTTDNTKKSYVGFMVMKYPHDMSNLMSLPSNINLGAWASLAAFIVMICCATTDKTSTSIRLNSSKQHQLPDWANPEKNFPNVLKSSPSEQLKTTHNLPIACKKIKVHS